METNRILPQVDDKRFGTLPLSYSRVTEIRREHAVLVQLAAVVLDCAPENVTEPKVQAATYRLIADRQAAKEAAKLAENS